MAVARPRGEGAAGDSRRCFPSSPTRTTCSSGPATPSVRRADPAGTGLEKGSASTETVPGRRVGGGRGRRVLRRVSTRRLLDGRGPAVTSSTPTVAASPTASSGQPAALVSYVVHDQVGDSFEAEIDVTNDWSSSISGWQIVLALPGDRVTAVANATGYESNHILLLGPVSSTSAIAPGATLRVYLIAQGTRTARPKSARSTTSPAGSRRVGSGLPMTPSGC